MPHGDAGLFELQAQVGRALLKDLTGGVVRGGHVHLQTVVAQAQPDLQGPISAGCKFSCALSMPFWLSLASCTAMATGNWLSSTGTLTRNAGVAVVSAWAPRPGWWRQ